VSFTTSFGFLILASSDEESKHYSEWVGTIESQAYHPCNLKKKDQNSNKEINIPNITKKNSGAYSASELYRPSERPALVGEVSANFSG
jgi:hypothetical protein